MKGIPSWLIDFIRGKGTPEDITYRWYNYFNAGCNKYLGQVPEDFFNMCFSTRISQDLKDELREYLIKNNF